MPVRFHSLLRQHDFIYERAPMKWLEGIPLANGNMGVMLWGAGAPLILDGYLTANSFNRNFSDPKAPNGIRADVYTPSQR